MRCVWIVSLIAGCGFTGSDTGGVDPTDPGGTGTGPGGTGTAPTCDVHVASLALCLTFDGHVVQDALAHPHPVAVASGIGSILRILSNSDAIKLDATSRIRFDESADFDVKDLTADMWIDPDHAAQTTRFTILDNHQQYTVSYETDQHVQCSITGGNPVRSQNPLGPGWHHVACRYDAGKRDLRVYVDGDVAGCGQGPGAIPTDGGAGLAIGASFDGTNYQNSFIGSLDNVHLYASSMTEDQICTDAGQQGCVKTCPDGGGDSGGGGGRPGR